MKRTRAFFIYLIKIYQIIQSNFDCGKERDGSGTELLREGAGRNICGSGTGRESKLFKIWVSSVSSRDRLTDLKVSFTSK